MWVHKVGRTTDDFGGNVLCAHANVWLEHMNPAKR
jgi:hypothetical protein